MDVAIETRSTAAGKRPAFSQLWTTGTSRWQCGHQWAMKRRSLARPSDAIDTWAPAKSDPVTSGIGWPIAGSLAVAAKSGKRAPVVEATTEEPAADEAGGLVELAPPGV